MTDDGGQLTIDGDKRRNYVGMTLRAGGGRTILVAGATGALGREAVRQCRARGYRVRALGRDSRRLQTVEADEFVLADGLVPETLQGSCDGVDAIISCLGASVIPELRHGRKPFTQIDYPANRNLIREAEKAGVRRFIYVSVFGAERLGRFDFVRAHEMVVDELRRSALEYSVLRATGFHSSMETILRIGGRIAVPEHNGGMPRTNPIHETDLAKLCVDAIEEPSVERDVGGPEALTRREIAEVVLAGRPFHRVPVKLLQLASLALRHINPRVSDLYGFIAEILQEDVLAPASGTISMRASQHSRCPTDRLERADNAEAIGPA
jgi:uncharacterized protein YbjT (DUF2867 family)